MENRGFVATLYFAPEIQGELETFDQQELKASDERAAQEEAAEWLRNRPKSPYKAIRLVLRHGKREVSNKPINDLN
jgi:hypothetical protein